MTLPNFKLAIDKAILMTYGFGGKHVCGESSVRGIMCAQRLWYCSTNLDRMIIERVASNPIMVMRLG